MGRHSSPTALSRAAKRAGVAATAVAAGASLTVGGSGAAQAASPISEVTEALEKASAEYVAVVTSGTAYVVKNGVEATSKVVGYWNDIPVIATLIPISEAEGLKMPLLGNLKLSSGSLGAGIAYTGGPFGSFSAVAGVGSDAAPALGVAVPNFGFIETTGPSTLNANILGLIAGKTAFGGPSADFSKGLALTGPTFKVSDGMLLGQLVTGNFKLDTGSISITDAGLQYDGPKLSGATGEKASVSLRGAGTLDIAFDAGSGTLGKVTKTEAPSGGIQATSADIKPVGVISGGTEFDGGTWTPSGVKDASVGVNGKGAGVSNTTEVEADATTDGAGVDVTNTLTGPGTDGKPEVTGFTASTDDGIKIKGEAKDDAPKDGAKSDDS